MATVPKFTSLTARSQNALTLKGKSPTCKRSQLRIPAVSESTEERLNEDPENKFYRFGKDAGKSYSIPTKDQWIRGAPRVRKRTAKTRQKELLTDLAALNERLAGGSPYDARKRLEYIRIRRENWEAIYHTVTESDAAATLSAIEDANTKVTEALSEATRERTSVAELKDQLENLQEEVAVAHERLHHTQSRVKENIARIDVLKKAALKLEDCRSEYECETAATAVATAEENLRVASEVAPAQAAVHRAAAAVALSESGTKLQVDAAGLEGALRGGARPKAKQRKGLESALELEESLKEFWYPVEFCGRLKEDMLVPFNMFGQAWVVFRDQDGRAACVKDECAHRACPLSLGAVVDGQVECPYHGWTYDREGSCTHMPSTVQNKGIKVKYMPCCERDGMIWVWPGLGTPPEIPHEYCTPRGYHMHAEIVLEVPVEHGLLLENLLDLAHAPFTHTSTFAKGWSVPEAVKFNAVKLLEGNWEPYPIDMTFGPPCMVLSKIGLAQPGKVAEGLTADKCEKHLHQLHVCLPSTPGTTRLLYRMSLDFLPWIRMLPGIDKLWVSMANQVLGEDLRLVVGQQNRLSKGGDVWANPVAYDKLGVRYRRWRNNLANGGTNAADQPVTMSAGDLLFGTEEDMPTE